MNIGGTEPNEPATPTAMNEAVEETGTVPPRKARRAHRFLGARWRFTRYLLEMVVAMMAGMAVLGVALAVLGEPPGYANSLVEYSPVMLVAVFAVVLPVELGVVGLTGHGPALLATLESGQFISTMELKASFLRPVSPGRIVGSGRVAHRDGDIAFLDGFLSDLDGATLATATATARVINMDPSMR